MQNLYKPPSDVRHEADSPLLLLIPALSVLCPNSAGRACFAPYSTLSASFLVTSDSTTGAGGVFLVSV